MKNRLYVFGTGHAMVTKLYNTCFALEQEGSFFVMDAGGGNGILQAFEAMSVPISDVRQMFLTHTHTDHILGGIWVVRAIGHAIASGGYIGNFTVWGHESLINAFQLLCTQVLQKKILSLFGSRILLKAVSNGQTEATPFGEVCFFDSGCELIELFGCSIRLPGGKRLVYLGDDPIRKQTESYLLGCDWLITEALCLESERGIHHPEKSFHSSVIEACKNAQALGVKRLILSHTEDTHGAQRKSLYCEEGSHYFKGELYVPDDREILELR